MFIYNTVSCYIYTECILPLARIIRYLSQCRVAMPSSLVYFEGAGLQSLLKVVCTGSSWSFYARQSAQVLACCPVCQAKHLHGWFEAADPGTEVDLHLHLWPLLPGHRCNDWICSSSLPLLLAFRDRPSWIDGASLGPESREHIGLVYVTVQFIFNWENSL